MSKPPSFQFYPDDWLSSKNIMLMTPEQEGAYIRLLAYSWPDGLPDDDDQLATLSRLNEGWFKGGSQIIRKHFVKRNGKLFNPRLILERQKQIEWRVKCRAGGEHSGKVRKDKALQSKGTSTKLEVTAGRVLELKGNSSSSSSSSSSTPINKNKNKRARASNKFIKPTAGEVEKYAESINYQIDGEQFCAFYETRGWILGNRQQMKSWQAAVVTWKKRDEDRVKANRQEFKEFTDEDYARVRRAKDSAK